MRPFILTLLFVLASGCQASLEVNTKDPKKVEEPEPPPSFNPADVPQVATSRIGVSHNLSLSPEASASAQCRCMAAVVGRADNAAFQWRSTPPTVGDDALVLGISNEGTPCDRPTGGRGPSIMAVEEEGGNIIVTLEEGRPGIPLARGAVFRRPPGEWLMFRANRRLPYDDALPGSGDAGCRVRLR